jgi:ATP-binding cassette, subfamily B, bacterial
MMERASAKAVWRHARELLRPVRKLYLAAGAAVMLSTLITLAGPALVRYAVDAGIRKDDTHPLNVAGLIFLGLALTKPFVVRAQIVFAARAGERFLDSLRVAAFDKLQALPLGFFERERAGVLVSRLTSDVQSLNELVREALLEIFGSGLQIVLTIVALVFLSPKLALISLVALPILIASSWSFHHGAGRAYHAIRDRVAETLTVLQEGLAGVRVVPARGEDARPLPAAKPGAGERVAPRIVREHQAVRLPSSGAGGCVDRRAARLSVDVPARRDLDRNDHRVRALSDPAVRSDRPLHGVAG